jgi:hypothetical protein
MPRLDAADGPAARALVEAYLLARRAHAALGPEAATQLDVIHRPRGEVEQRRFAKLAADPPLDASLLQPLDPADPSTGLLLTGAMAVKPSEALPRLLAGASLRFDTCVTKLSELDADLIVICAGMGLTKIFGVDAPPLTGRLGQLECAPSSAPPNAIADGGYAVEAFGKLVFGATFEDAAGEPQVSDAACRQNLKTLASGRPLRIGCPLLGRRRKMKRRRMPIRRLPVTSASSAASARAAFCGRRCSPSSWPRRLSSSLRRLRRTSPKPLTPGAFFAARKGAEASHVS